MKPVAVRIRLVVMATASALVLGTLPAAAAGPPALTRQGRILWQFEALLHDTFGDRHVSAHGLDFACADRLGCSPLAYWSPYLFTFAGARHSAYHLSSRHFANGDFGNYPEIVRIDGKVIACDRPERRFLIRYEDGIAFSLDCLAP